MKLPGRGQGEAENRRQNGKQPKEGMQRDSMHGGAGASWGPHRESADGKKGVGVGHGVKPGCSSGLLGVWAWGGWGSHPRKSQVFTPRVTKEA